VVLLSKRVIITAALPYSNSDLHIGHIASTYLPPDILYRYMKLKGVEAIHICASDDFGTPILISAEKQGKRPEEYVEYWNRRFREDLHSLGIDYDLFDKTSSKENINLVQSVFLKLHEKGYIYESDVDQFYCEYDKKFLPDRYVKGKCPYCGAEDQYSDGCEVCGRVLQPGQILFPKCSICGREPVKKSTRHYFFKLSAFSERLRSWLNENKNLQQDAVRYVINWIQDGLQDWDITRDIPWGVPIPLEKAEGKVLYGWFDNHLCYITTALKCAGKLNDEGKEFWNSSTIYHFIGKDIVYHHYLFLPAVRIGHGDYKLPDFIPVRGHMLLEGKKISKSRNWAITVRDFLEKYPPDYLRYYLARVVSSDQSDCNFDWNDFKEKINNELVANIGNFVYRTLSFAKRSFGGKVPDPRESEENEMEESFRKAFSYYTQAMESLTFERAVKSILEFSDSCNQYFQKKEPWKSPQNNSDTIYFSLNAVKRISLLLYPFLPFTASKIWEQLGLAGKVDEYRISEVEKPLTPGQTLGEPEILFQKV
jgi:methionyl-tRNA synthetase